MKEFKGTKGTFIADGLHIRKEGKSGSIGQAFLMSFKRDYKGKSIHDIEGEANAKLWASAYECLISGKKVVNLDEAISYSKKLIDKALGL
jgi:hypothetical protein